MKRTPLLSAVALSVAIVAPLFVGATEGVPRIGIISDADARSTADLLLIELQKAKCEMVERDEIKKVLGEQALHAGLNRAETLRIGRLLKADGLVLISPGTNRTISVRLVAVAPGVVVWYADAAADKRSVPTVAESLVSYFPKLSVKAGEAVPVSLLRVRPAFGTARAIQLADDLTRLLLLRLVREPSLFVLEREDLTHIEDESHWSGRESGFWAGSVVVEGRAAPDLAQTNRVALTLSAQRSTNSVTGPVCAEWTEEGDAANLPQLVDRAAVRLRGQIGTGAKTVAWEPRVEGLRLLAITPHLMDPRKQKAALGTAMALGCRDPKTANEYRGALRAIAYRDAVRFGDVHLHLAPGDGLRQQAEDFLELVRFHNEYQPPGGFKEGEDRQWSFSYAMPLKDVETFFDELQRVKRAGEVRAAIGEIQTECRRAADRMLMFDPFYGAFMKGHVPVHNARYRCDKMRDILDVYRRWVFLPPTNETYNVIGSTGGMWYLDRERAEPMFSSAATESLPERDRLWEKFQQELAASDRPDVRLNRALRHLEQATTPEQRRECRRQLRGLIADFGPHFRTASLGGAFAYLWSAAYPGYRQQQGRYTLPGSKDDPSTVAEVRADSQHACQTFLAVTPPGTLRLDDAEHLVVPYVELLTEDEARSVYRLTAEFNPPWKYKLPYIFPPPVDTFAFQQRLATKYPTLADKEYLAEAARRDRLKKTPTAYLAVTNTIAFPAHPIARTSWITWRIWRDDCLWLIWDGGLFVVDPTCNTCELIAPPPDEGNPGSGSWSPRALTDDTFLFYSKPFDLDPSAGVKGTVLAWRPLTGGDWRTARLTFEFGAITRVGQKLYLTTAAPRLVVYQSEGLVEFDPATSNCVTLRSPGAPAVRREDPKAPVAFEHLTFGAGAKDGLLLGHCGRELYGWDPTTGQVRLLDPRPKPPQPTQIEPPSRAYGFDFCLDPLSTLIDLSPGAGGCHDLRVIRNGSTQPETIPLRFASGIGACESCPIAGSAALYVPLAGNHGLHMVPYADIQQWLTTHPLTTGRAGVSNVTNNAPSSLSGNPTK